MSDIFKKRGEVLLNPDRNARKKIIQSKLDEIKKTKDEEIILPTSKKEEEWSNWLGKLTGIVGGTLTDGIIYLTKFLGLSGLDLVQSVATEIKNGLIPDSVQEFFAENKDKINNWVNKKRKGEKVTELVDEIYISGFSISKEGNKYIVRDNTSEIKNDNEVEILEIFNVPNNNLSGVLDEALISRSLTEAGEGGILKITRHLNIDIQDEESINNIKPVDLANAYLKEYKVTKNDGTLYNLEEVNPAILISKSVPNHIKDYILMVKGTSLKDNEMGFLKDSLKEYSKITTNAKGLTREIKETVEGGLNNAIEAFKNPGEALSKIENPMSLLGLIAGIGYLLFFSEDKKTAWKALIGIYSADAIFNIATGKSGFSSLQKGSNKMFEWLNGDNAKKELIEKITKEPNKGILIIELMSLKSTTLFENFEVDEQGIVSIKNLDILIPNKEHKEKFIKLFDDGEDGLKKALTGTFEKFLELKKIKKESLKSTKQRLEKKYNTTDYPNAYFGQILCAELSEIKINTTTNNTTEASTITDTNIPENINSKLNNKPSEIEKNTYNTILGNYDGNINTIKIYVLYKQKKESISYLESIKNSQNNNNNKIIIENLINELKK